MCFSFFFFHIFMTQKWLTESLRAMPSTLDALFVLGIADLKFTCTFSPFSLQQRSVRYRLLSLRSFMAVAKIKTYSKSKLFGKFQRGI